MDFGFRGVESDHDATEIQLRGVVWWHDTPYFHLRYVESDHDATEIQFRSVVGWHDTPYFHLRYVESDHDAPHFQESSLKTQKTPDLLHHSDKVSREAI